MSYSTDKPIETQEDDLLGRSYFAKRLGDLICRYNVENVENRKDGLVIGLYGKWGTGKTSVVNMIEESIGEYTKNDKNKPLFVRFSPWNYSDKSSLINLFFRTLYYKINVQDSIALENKKKLGKALHNYAGILDAFSMVPMVPMVAQVLATIGKTVVKEVGADWMQTPDLEEMKGKLERELIAAKKKIIVVIDDIDRLTNSQIRDIFQLVKQVADFPNMIYILVMDREVVGRALTEVHNVDGNEYLEKIVQIPVQLPELKKSKIHDILFEKLDTLISDFSFKPNLDRHWEHVFRNCVAPYISTLRDVNRLVNTFRFRYGMSYRETDFADMLAIITLEVFEPHLYQWICNNKEAVCGAKFRNLLPKHKKKSDYRKWYAEKFTNMGVDSDIALRCISTLFPVFANDVDEQKYDYYHDYQADKNLRAKMRVAYKDRFELYFTCDLDNIKIPRSTINECIFKHSKEELRGVIEKINKKGDSVYFLEEIFSLLDEIPEERLVLIAFALLGFQGNFSGESIEDIYRLSACDIVDHIIEKIIRKIDIEEKRYQFIRQAIEEVDANGLGTIAKIIYQMDTKYEGLEGAEDGQIINIEHLEETKKIYQQRIYSIERTGSILGIYNFGLIFLLWKRVDKAGLIDYLNRLFTTETNILKFICTMTGWWNGSDGSGWYFYSEYYSEYISNDRVYNIIQNFNKSKLSEFTETEQIKLATFVLSYHKDEMDSVTKDKAMELVEQWKAEFIQ